MSVGVLLATFNGNKYIEEQLDSILSQTVAVDEIIISDDGSSDGTYEFLCEYASKNPQINIKVIQNTGKYGPSKNFENAFLNSSADYLFFCDQDDVWKENKVEIFMDAVKKNPDCGLYFSDADVVDENLSLNQYTAWGYFWKESKKLDFGNDGVLVLQKEWSVKKIIKCNYITGMNMMVKREVLSKICPFDGIILHDDYITICCTMLSEICAINKATAMYRQHSGNYAGTKKQQKRITSVRAYIRDYLIKLQYNIDNIAYYYRRACIMDKLKTFESADVVRYIKFMTRRLNCVRSDFIKAFFVLLFEGIKGNYSRHCLQNLFFRDVFVTLYLRKNERIKRFNEKFKK